jgi:hypothetical protein
MFGLIAVLVLAEATRGTAAADRIAAAAAPGVNWIGRWLPLFYVPSLVMLPLALKALPGALVVKARHPHRPARGVHRQLRSWQLTRRPGCGARR